MTVVGGPLMDVRLTSRIRAWIAATRSRTRSSVSADAISSRLSSTSRRIARAGGRNETPSSLSFRLTHHSSSRGSSMSASGFPLPARLSKSPRFSASWICLSTHDCHATPGGLRSVTNSRLRLAAKLAVDHHVPPFTAAEAGPPQHGFAGEAGLVECLLLGDVADFRARLDSLQEGVLEEVRGEQPLGLAAVALAAVLRQEPDADVPAVTVRRRAVERPDPAHVPDHGAFAVEDGERPAIVRDGLLRRHPAGQPARFPEPEPAHLPRVLRPRVLPLESRDVGSSHRTQPDHPRTFPFGSATMAASTPSSASTRVSSPATESPSVTTAAASSC